MSGHTAMCKIVDSPPCDKINFKRKDYSTAIVHFYNYL